MSKPNDVSLISTESSLKSTTDNKDAIKQKIISYRKSLDKIFNYRYTICGPQYDIEDNFTSHTSFYGERFVLVNLIHNGRHICFNCSDREILYAIIECVKLYNGKNYAEFKESCYGKAVNFDPKNLPPVPPFQHIMIHFQKNYFDRLTLLDQHFIKNNHNHEHLIAKKKALYIYPNDCIYLLPLPKDVVTLIRDFITYVDFKKCQYLRKEYAKERIKCFK